MTDRSQGPVPVLVVDDSLVARTVLKRIIEGDGRYRVAGAVGDASSALAFLARERVSLVLLDIEMPGQSGLTALPAILDAAQGACVLIVSSSAAAGAQASVRALALGAADTLVKPGAGNLAGRFASGLIERIDRLTRVAEAPPAAARAAAAGSRREPPRVIAIGASTGGIHALGRVLDGIDANCDAPMLVTQHLPPSFMPYFAAQLAQSSRRPCEVAMDSVRLRPGHVYVAPGDAHLGVAPMTGGHVIKLTHEASASGCLPSVDPMFASIAAVFGEGALGVVLSGMGRDGSIGARDLVAAGGAVIVQDQESSVVWGMPGAVAKAGLAEAVLPPDAIARSIRDRFAGRR